MSGNKQQQRTIADGPAPRAARKVSFFPVPVDLQDWDDGRKVIGIGLYTLNVDEEVTAVQLAGESDEKRGIECVKASLAELELAPSKEGGEPRVVVLSAADGSAHLALNAMPPQLRRLCGTAYADIHLPTAEQAGGFLGGRRVVIR